MIDGFFDVDNILAKLDSKGDFLQRLNETVDWEEFRPLLREVRAKVRKNNSGRRPFDEVLMFKILVLQSLFNLSDDTTERMILDRLTFRRYLGLSLSSRVPDATTIWLFRDSLVQLRLVKRLFDMFDLQLAGKGFHARQGSIIDATMVEVPRQKISRDEKEELVEKGEVEDWSEEKSRQKDTDAKWTKKNDTSYFGYKNHVNVDVEHKFIRKYAVTDASVHDSRLLKELLDYSNTNSDVYADSAYRSRKNLDMLEILGFRERIHRKAHRNRPLSEREKQGNKTKSRTRARVEHVFGVQLKQAGSLLMRCIGILRAEAQIGLRNIAYNMSRLVTLCR